MTVKLLTEHHLKFLSLKGGCMSLHLSKCQIVGNHMSRLNTWGCTGDFIFGNNEGSNDIVSTSFDMS